MCVQFFFQHRQILSTDLMEPSRKDPNGSCQVELLVSAFNKPIWQWIHHLSILGWCGKSRHLEWGRPLELYPVRKFVSEDGKSTYFKKVFSFIWFVNVRRFLGHASRCILVRHLWLQFACFQTWPKSFALRAVTLHEWVDSETLCQLYTAIGPTLHPQIGGTSRNCFWISSLQPSFINSQMWNSIFYNKAWEVSDFAPLWGNPSDIKIIQMMLVAQGYFISQEWMNIMTFKLGIQQVLT